MSKRDTVEKCDLDEKCKKCLDFPCKLSLYLKGYSEGQNDKVKEVDELS